MLLRLLIKTCACPFILGCILLGVSKESVALSSLTGGIKSHAHEQAGVFQDVATAAPHRVNPVYITCSWMTGECDFEYCASRLQDGFFEFNVLDASNAELGISVQDILSALSSLQLEASINGDPLEMTRYPSSGAVKTNGFTLIDSTKDGTFTGTESGVAVADCAFIYEFFLWGVPKPPRDQCFAITYLTPLKDLGLEAGTYTIEKTITYIFQGEEFSFPSPTVTITFDPSC